MKKLFKIWWNFYGTQDESCSLLKQCKLNWAFNCNYCYFLVKEIK